MRRITYAASFAASIAILAATPAQADQQMDALVACMWQKMPTSTAAFAENENPQREFSLFLKAMAPCGTGLSGVHLTSLKKTFAKTRPSTIGPDIEIGDNAFVCPTEGDGKPGACKAAGE